MTQFHLHNPYIAKTFQNLHQSQKWLIFFQLPGLLALPFHPKNPAVIPGLPGLGRSLTAEANEMSLTPAHLGDLRLAVLLAAGG